jgi:ATP-dependent HslUV protease ATP-binding subunit HslU
MPQMEKVFKSQRMERMEITIGEAKPLLREVEMEKHLNSDQITKDAILVT